MEQARVALQHGAVSLSAEGRESFVKEVIGMWKELLAAGTPAPSQHVAVPALPPPSTSSGTAALANFENTYDSVDGKLKIIADVPGNSKAVKARNVALVLLYGHHLQGTDQIASELIREACTDHGCFDSGNFASSIKALKDKIVMNTKAGGGYDVKLTAPGRKAAKEFVESLNNEAA
jgi:hypothetical protein